jgi:hypothetical protein
MIFSSYNSHSVNFTPPLSRVETTSEKDAAISGLYSAAIGKTAEIECLKYKGYQFYPNGDLYEGDFVNGNFHECQILITRFLLLIKKIFTTKNA